MLQILSKRKSFADPWIGHRWLNERGMHVARMRAAAAVNALRRLGAPLDADAAVLRRDGCIALPDFLSAERFAALREEVEAVVTRVEEADPMPVGGEGFGAKQSRPWGFDRADGGTVNRFVTVDPATMPETAAFAAEPRLSRLTRAAVGLRFPAAKLEIYVTRQGGAEAAADQQKAMHRDTFHASVKFWYFLRDVRPEDGPFTYVPGSHRLDAPRRAWEDAHARRIVRQRRGRGGAFRIAETELAGLGLPPPRAFAVPANTLVLADTLGFHRRGDAAGPAERLALYGAVRPPPFLPLGL